MILYGEFVYPIATEVSAQFYQPLLHCYFHIGNSFKSVFSYTIRLRWKQILQCRLVYN
jgi:hypothetical protein